jgi:hypothetical protein
MVILFKVLIKIEFVQEILKPEFYLFKVRLMIKILIKKDG